MKNGIIVLAALIIFPFFGFNQSIDNLDYISSFNDGVAAIKKDNQWAFINKDGDIVINFRNDLVSRKSHDGNYPIFQNERCLIVEERNGISYFGYMDTTGEVVIKPQFLNATHFSNNIATVLKLVREVVGKNEVLGKNVINYSYFEVTIDTAGEIKRYLTQKSVNVILDKKFLHEPPRITSKLISDNLYAFLNKNNKWSIKKIIE